MEVKILANGKELLVSGENFEKLMQNSVSGRIRNGKLKILGIKNTPISSNSEKQPERLSRQLKNTKKLPQNYLKILI